MDPPPWRSLMRRRAPGASTTIHSTATRPSRITSDTPRRPTFAPVEDPSEGPFPNGGWWGYAQRRPRQRSRTFKLCSPRRAALQDAFLCSCSQRCAANYSARLHHRPSCSPTVTSTSKQADTSDEVMTCSSGPAATNFPCRTRPAWVKPRRDLLAVVGDQDRGGTPGVRRASAPSRATRRSRAPRSRPAAGSSSRSNSGRLIRARAKQDVLSLTLGDHPERAVGDGGEAGLAQAGGPLRPSPPPCTCSTMSPSAPWRPLTTTSRAGSSGRSCRVTEPLTKEIRGRSVRTSTLPEPGSEYLHRSGRGPQPRAGQGQQCGLAGSVRAQDHPSLPRLHRPVDVVQDDGAFAPHADTAQCDDRGRSASTDDVNCPLQCACPMRRPTRPIRPAQHWAQTRSPASQSQISRRYPSTIPSNSSSVDPGLAQRAPARPQPFDDAALGAQHRGQVLAVEDLGQPAPRREPWARRACAVRGVRSRSMADEHGLAVGALVGAHVLLEVDEQRCVGVELALQ